MSLAFRAYFALPATLTTSSGVVTNAVHGFVAMVANIVKDHHPSALAVAFDLPGETFRDQMVEDYKGGRAETPDDLPPQFDMIRELMEALAIPVVGVPGFEADDVLATLATEARDRDCDVVVVTGDRDSFQLIEDPHIRVLYNKRGVSDYSLYDEAGAAACRRPSTCCWPPCGVTPRTTCPGSPGWGRRQRPSCSTPTATWTAFTPTWTSRHRSCGRTWRPTRVWPGPTQGSSPWCAMCHSELT
jgi:DNA polymerase-1